MEPTLDQALQAVFGTAQPVTEKVAAPVQSEELNQARKELEETERTIQKGNWEGFEKAMKTLKKLLGEPPKKPK